MMFSARALGGALLCLALAAPAHAVPTFSATPLPTNFGAPFPGANELPNSTALLIPNGGPITTPFGIVEEFLIDSFVLDFGSSNFFGSPDQTFVYSSARFSNDFLDAPGGNVVGSFEGFTTNFEVIVENRPNTTGASALGSFTIEIVDATFDGEVRDAGDTFVANMQTRIDPVTNPSTGTALFSNIGFQQYVQTDLSIGGQYQVCDGSLTFPAPGSCDPNGYTDVPITASSITVPVTGTLGLALIGAAGFLARRRVAA